MKHDKRRKSKKKPDPVIDQVRGDVRTEHNSPTPDPNYGNRG